MIRNDGKRQKVMKFKPLSLHAYRWPTPRFTRPPAPEAAAVGGRPAMEHLLASGGVHAALHEIHADGTAHAAAAAGFAAGLAAGTAGRRPILWVRQALPAAHAGGQHVPGLAALGLDPRQLVLVHAGSVADTLWTGAEAARCGSLGAVLIELWGEARALDMIASRRLSLASQAAGVATLLLRIGARLEPSAAWTRWLVRCAPSAALTAAAPGHPTYHLVLQRHRGGEAPREWRVEWNRERKSFQSPAQRGSAPLPCPVVPVPADRPAAAGVAARLAV